MIFKKKAAVVMLLFLLGLLLRGLFFYCFTAHGQRAWLCYDSAQYHERALSIATSHCLTEQNSEQKAYRLPGYPTFLASVYAFTNNNLKIALWLQVFLAAFIPVLVFMLAQMLLPGLVGLAFFAMTLSCFHVGMILFAGMLATESLAVLLILMFLILLLKYHEARSLKILLFAGALLGVLSLVRPVGHYMIFIVACWLWWQRASFKHIIAFIGTWGVCVAPWLIRNLLLAGGICFHTLPGIHFLQYTAAAVVMQRDHIEYVPARTHLLKLWQQRVEQPGQKSEYQRCVLAEKIALEHIKQHPWYAIKHGAIELFKTLCALHSTQIVMADIGCLPTYTSQTTWREKIVYNLFPPLKTVWLQYLIYADVFMTFVLLLGSFLGLLGLFLQRKITAGMVLCLLIVGLLWGLTIAYGCARLRLPIEPMMMILTAAGGYYAFCWLFKKNN